MKIIRKVVLALFLGTLFSLVQLLSIGQSVTLSTDFGSLKMVSISDVKIDANLKAFYSDGNGAITGEALWIDN